MNNRDLRKAIKALRTTKAPRIRVILGDEEGGRCPLGVIAEAFGLPVVEGDERVGDTYKKLKEMGFQVTTIYTWNDGDNLSFAEVADRLEAGQGIES